MPMRDQPVGDHHAMALKVDALGAHVSSPRVLGNVAQLRGCALDLLSQHGSGAISEAVVRQRYIGRIWQGLLSPAAEFFYPEISDSSLRQSFFQRFAIEVRQSARHGEGADINQRLD